MTLGHLLTGPGHRWRGENLMPLYSGGLWLAVMLMPPARLARPDGETHHRRGAVPVVKWLMMPLPAITSAAVAAKVSDWKRVS